MLANKRVARRTKLHRTGWVSFDRPEAPLECCIVDITDAGAKIELTGTQGFPEVFDLLLTRDGSVRRRCTIVWREVDALGLRFLNRPKLKEHP
jgi:hypothetical protein